jgi:hypothetical protein
MGLSSSDGQPDQQERDESTQHTDECRELLT